MWRTDNGVTGGDLFAAKIGEGAERRSILLRAQDREEAELWGKVLLTALCSAPVGKPFVREAGERQANAHRLNGGQIWCAPSLWGDGYKVATTRDKSAGENIVGFVFFQLQYDHNVHLRFMAECDGESDDLDWVVAHGHYLLDQGRSAPPLGLVGVDASEVPQTYDSTAVYYIPPQHLPADVPSHRKANRITAPLVSRAIQLENKSPTLLGIIRMALGATDTADRSKDNMINGLPAPEILRHFLLMHNVILDPQVLIDIVRDLDATHSGALPHDTAALGVLSGIQTLADGMSYIRVRFASFNEDCLNDNMGKTVGIRAKDHGAVVLFDFVGYGSGYDGDGVGLLIRGKFKEDFSVLAVGEQIAIVDYIPF